MPSSTDFKFTHIPSLENWIILAPHRAKRPDVHGVAAKHVCPFCHGNESNDPEVYRIGGEEGDDKWSVRVVKNKYPFAPIHEVVIHTADHKQSISDISLEHVKLVIEAFVNRFNTHLKQGTVCIFSNSGHDAGESISHSHSQIAVVPPEIPIVVPSLEDFLDYRGEHLKVKEFMVVAPPYSQWPDETWIVPDERGKLFGEITYEEMESLAYILRRLVFIFEARHGHDFPYNFYIYPHRDWYLRIMPRAKIAGGFEIATGIFVNTQDPKDSMEFIKKHFFEEDPDKIKISKAEYRRGV
jgi:UDPglucose--hexose-1-phosphate uridylyltransferase